MLIAKLARWSNHFVLWIFSLFFKVEIQIEPEELEEGGGKLRTSRVSSEFCCPISTILDSDIPVAALEGSCTFGYALMEPMLDIKVLEGTN